MSYEVGDAELKAVMSLDSPKRYTYFLEKVADWEEIWSLGDDDGWALISDGLGNELIPVWPASAYAFACCTDIWKQYRPQQITLENWLQKWIPGMIADKRSVAVFPLPNDKGIVVAPKHLHDDLKEAIEQYE